MGDFHHSLKLKEFLNDRHFKDDDELKFTFNYW